MKMYNLLQQISNRPEPFEFYTAETLWADEHTSKQMLAFHLNESVDISSRNAVFINRSAEWIVSYFNLGPGKAVADFGCGPGLYTTRLARTGADVTGIDFSPRSIAYAQSIAEKEQLDIHYIQQNYLHYDTDKQFDLVLMIMCDFCALSPAQRQTMLNKFHSLLKPDGSVLLDVYTLNAFEQKEETAVYEKNLLDGFWSADDYYGFLNTFKYDKEKVSLDKHTIIEEDSTRVVYNWLQYFDRKALSRELTRAGFVIDDFFADVAGTSFDPALPEMAVIVSKPK